MAKVSINNLNSSWIVSQEESKVLYEINSAKLNKRRFVSGFQSNQWDGEIHLYNPYSSKLPAGLVYDSIVALENNGFNIEVEGIPELPEYRTDAQLNFDLDPVHQIPVLEAMCNTYCGIVHAATNSGKTKIAEAWCSLNACKVLYLVPSKELLRQTLNSFKHDTNLNVGHISSEEDWEIGEDVTICLVSSISKRVKKRSKKIINERAVNNFLKIAHLFDALIVDECHHLTAEGWRWVIKKLKSVKYRFGLSGSPWEVNDYANELKIKSLLGPVIARVTNEELIERGWSAKPTIHMVPVTTYIDFTNESNKEEEEIAFDDIYALGIAQNSLRNNIIVKLCERAQNEQKLCLVITIRISQCEALSHMLTLKNINHRVIIGSSEKSERATDLEDFKNQEYNVLISTVLSEGIDISELNYLIFAAGGKSSKQLLQRVGRGIRKKTNGENSVIIYDFIDNAHSILLHHTKLRKRLYNREGFDIVETGVFF